mmetsp:Transcript_27131/g.46230  ORF Transcript_27131/g.46230 Transcript_27131/m.46230 type:complete len:297 (+) Transcript_27131:107-997(+)|eukprot:CAMPEP_0183705552 /NCGR_PEP_ID=MMETSP0737-20130205/2596_1 /TAXON_ID=385413 /ORGANISM="Thalassiosira miniscula, Strain CCMP1093" /LENGTH=296 /DNA_ID=CAMNT_0025932711 /DNA_START=96 /DNA_END=986 /DNA_ORIENTATION=+
MKLLTSNVLAIVCALDCSLVTQGDPNHIPAPSPRVLASTPAVPPYSAGAGGDPHFTLWSGKKYDFHGECDLVMISKDDFMNGLGFHVHIRTKIEKFYSYIEAVAVKIGEDVFELQGGMNTDDKYLINGVENGPLPSSFENHFAIKEGDDNGYKVYSIMVDEKDHENFRLKLKARSFMGIRFVRTNSANFASSGGLLGDFETGLKLGRSGEVIEDPIAFAMDWQVGPDDPILLSPKIGSVQHPEKCKMPSATSRRVRDGGITDDKARKICAGAMDLDDCVFDVVATNNADVALDYFY